MKIPISPLTKSTLLFVAGRLDPVYLPENLFLPTRMHWKLHERKETLPLTRTVNDKDLFG